MEICAPRHFNDDDDSSQLPAEAVVARVDASALSSTPSVACAQLNYFDAVRDVAVPALLASPQLSDNVDLLCAKNAVVTSDDCALTVRGARALWALTLLGAKHLCELNEDVYEALRTASETINARCYDAAVETVHDGHALAVADGEVQTREGHAFASTAQAFQCMLHPGRRWTFNPQFPIARVVGAACCDVVLLDALTV